MARRTKGLATPKAARRRERKRKAGIQVRSKKEYTYRGMTIDKLQDLNFEDFKSFFFEIYAFHFGRDDTKLGCRI